MFILNKLLSLLPINRIIASMFKECISLSLLTFFKAEILNRAPAMLAHSLNVYISSDKGSADVYISSDKGSADGKIPSEEFPSLDAFSFRLQGSSMIVIASH